MPQAFCIIPLEGPLKEIRRDLRRMTYEARLTFFAVLSKATSAELHHIGEALRSGDTARADLWIDEIARR